MPARSEALLAFRYELKYLTEEARVRAIREFIRPFVRIDRFAAAEKRVRYAVCSLYLDTPGLLLYRQSLHGIRDRYKLRIRSYSEDPCHPLFLEVKRRLDGVVLKRRCALERDRLGRALAGEADGSGTAGNDCTAALAEFAQLARRTGCRPVLRVKYFREAYESRGGDPVRVTFDTDLCHAVTLDPDVSLNGHGWEPTPVEGTILELKFTDRYPTWVRDLVQAFDLERLSLPKYGLSMTRALEAGRFAPPGAAGLAQAGIGGRR